MHTTANFSNQSNARRAAKRMIAGGKAPASDFEIKPDAAGLFTIHWLTNGPADVETEIATAADEADQPASSTEAIETEIATASAAADQPAPRDADPPPPGATEPPPETEAADTDPELAAFETPRLVAELERRGFRHLPPRRARATATATEPRRSKNAELDAAAARGIMPTKPDVTSHANHHYQRRFDKLAELAEAGDWDAVRAYECTGVNSYAKMVRQYRHRLLAAQDASTAAV
jgi:hypothetical protein